MLVRLLQPAIRALWPAQCVGCSAPGEWWCSSCDAAVLPIRFRTCPRCHRQSDRGAYCHTCRRHGALTGILAGARYTEPLSTAIHALKYRHAAAIAPQLARYLILPLAELTGLNRAVLIPVPLHRYRLHTRGHNQAELLARLLSESMSLPLNTELVRHRATVSQTKLDRRHRAANVANAFSWTGGSLKGRIAIIVDDVSTTGATLNACAKSLRAAGASQIWGLVVAQR